MTIKLNGSSSGSVSLDAPADTTGGLNVDLKLPVADGTNGQFLKTDGSGQLSFGTVSIPADQGKILGVASVTYEDQQRGWTQSTSWGDSGMEITYTPTASNSTAIISLNAMVYGGPSQYIYLALRQDDAILGGGSDDYLPIIIGNVSNWESCSASWHITPTWTAGTATSFQIYMRRYTNSQGTVYLGWGSSGYGTYKDGLMIQEVKA
tara:strand:- start:315 stop:935 length:621 start_codon:yes stop_codon:yes gene_type:complete